MTEHTLTLLHLSDLHEKGSRDSDLWRRRRVLGDAWKKNLDRLAEDGPYDLVCFTGDAAFSGKADEFSQVTDFFAAVLERLGLGFDRFFVVPGNHDIDRDKGDEVWQRWRRDLFRTDRLAFARWLAGKGRAPLGFNNRERSTVLKRQKAYRDWVRVQLKRPELDPTASGHERLGYRQTLRLPNLPFPAHVVGLDTSWMCGDDNDASHLWLTDEQVMAHAADGKGESLDGFRLCLLHHPLDDLADGSEARRLLADRVDLVLRGHLHEAEVQTWADPERRLRQVVAGCLYENDRYPNACERIRVTLDDAGRPLAYEMRFRGWSPRGHWFDDNGLYPGTIDGRLTWQIAARPTAPAFQRAERLFVGREDELEKLEVLLGAGGPAGPVAICAVQGMPGVGKSYLAERFGIVYRDRFPGGLWPLVLDPESPHPTPDSLLLDLAGRLKLSQALGGLAERVRDRLLRPRSLLAIENVDDAALAQAVAGLIGAIPGCPVLVTGRFQDFGTEYGWQQVPVRPFDETTALRQLDAELAGVTSKETAESYRDLVRKLGFLPLALHLAAGYLRAGHSVDGFLRKLEEAGYALPPAGAAELGLNENKTRHLLSSTFELSLRLLEDSLGPSGELLLAAFADLGHAPAEGFGASLGSAIAGLEAFAFEELTVAARGLSVLEEFPCTKPAGRRYRLHPLLAELLRKRSGAESEKRALGRMTEWFCFRLPVQPAGQESEQGRRWKELETEFAALVSWLARVPASDRVRVERAGSRYAIRTGPFHAWSAFCELLLGQELSEEEQSDALWTLGNVSLRSGDPDRAETAARSKAELNESRGEEREKALALGLLADILEERGDSAEALRIRREEQLPVYERIGDVRAQAVTMGKIADILQQRGDSDEALRIRREEQLPVFERLGDVRERALTMGQIADILQQRGDSHEALRIRREEELPVFERLGDVRERAVTMGKIADILEQRGDSDEALSIRREEELPVYERLGDVQSRAVTMGKIAELLRGRGEVEEAIRIRTKEELPAYERLGSSLDLVYGRTNLAILYLHRAGEGDRERASALLELALREAVKRGYPEKEWVASVLKKAGLTSIVEAILPPPPNAEPPK